MKATITTISLTGLFLLCFGKAHSQGTLQFNQVLLLTNNSATCSSCWQVPAGKVWKVVSCGTYTGNAMQGYINGTLYGFFTDSYSNNSAYWNSFSLPFWLPAGTILGYANASSSGPYFSVIEFNVVP